MKHTVFIFALFTVITTDLYITYVLPLSFLTLENKMQVIFHLSSSIQIPFVSVSVYKTRARIRHHSLLVIIFLCLMQANANPYHCHHSLSSSSRDGRAEVSFTCACVERLRFLVGPIYFLSAYEATQTHINERNHLI
jgi:hypothetical protein